MKSILMFDTPSNCKKCPLIYWSLCGWTCKPTRGMIDDDNEKPEWCPLRQMPDKAAEDLSKGLDAMDKLESVEVRTIRRTE